MYNLGWMSQAWAKTKAAGILPKVSEVKHRVSHSSTNNRMKNSQKWSLNFVQDLEGSE